MFRTRKATTMSDTNEIYSETFHSKSGREFTITRHKRNATAPTIDVSVIVPVYNASKTLRQAIDSIRTDQVVPIEIILVNDNTPDDSQSIIEEYFEKDTRIAYIKHDDNYGYGASMNDGIQAAQGKWISILEPDDYVLPRMLELMLFVRNKAINGDKNVQVEGSDSKDYDCDVIKSPYIRESRLEDDTPRGDGPVELLECSYKNRIHPKNGYSRTFDITDKGVVHLLRHHPSIWSALYRKQFLTDKNIDFVEYPGAGWADNEFFYKTLLNAERIAYCCEPFYVYREETDKEFEKFARANKTLPLDRWNSMMDIIEITITKDGIPVKDNDEIMKAHIAKGFTYLSGQLDANGWDDEELLNEALKMFKRMDQMLVTDEARIKPQLRQLYIDMMGCDGMLRDKLRYKLGLASEFFYTIRCNGVKYGIKRVKTFLAKNKEADNNAEEKETIDQTDKSC